MCVPKRKGGQALKLQIQKEFQRNKNGGLWLEGNMGHKKILRQQKLQNICALWEQSSKEGKL